jgi:PPK2 family polyphosphate:nucleotide phosphotransferase
MSRLKEIRPGGPASVDKAKIERETERLVDQIAVFSKKLFAEKKESVLVILQGMCASGKDGLVRTLFQKVSPTWINVHSFKKPTDEEFAHDFLWRIKKKLPSKGIITVFNRSYYEDILVPSVYGTFGKATIEKRYEQINEFEKNLEENGTHIIKVYLHISQQKQASRLKERINNPSKHWKHDDHDWDEKLHWKGFMGVYERIFEKCDQVPWHVVPANKNWVKVNLVGKLLVQSLTKINPKYPNLVSERFVPNYEKAKETFMDD